MITPRQKIAHKAKAAARVIAGHKVKVRQANPRALVGPRR